jgi:hypothetical protein
MEMNVAKNYSDYNLRAKFSSADYDRQKTTGDCGIFQVFG